MDAAIRFRCRVGHGYLPDDLAEAHAFKGWGPPER